MSSVLAKKICILQKGVLGCTHTKQRGYPVATKKNARQELVKASERRSKKARTERAKRDAKITKLRANGKSQLEIAEEVGLTYQRVGQILGGAKRGERVKGGGK
jgi:hypothetical protein